MNCGKKNRRSSLQSLRKIRSYYTDTTSHTWRINNDLILSPSLLKNLACLLPCMSVPLNGVFSTAPYYSSGITTCPQIQLFLLPVYYSRSSGIFLGGNQNRKPKNLTNQITSLLSTLFLTPRLRWGKWRRLLGQEFRLATQIPHQWCESSSWSLRLEDKWYCSR